MNLSNKTLRNVLRAIHLVIGALVVAYLYTPLGNVEWFGSLVRTSIPILTITGLSMWQMPSLTKILKRQPVLKQI
jgi:hypothetical protein